jgi:hypothetical protein
MEIVDWAAHRLKEADARSKVDLEPVKSAQA